MSDKPKPQLKLIDLTQILKERGEAEFDAKVQAWSEKSDDIYGFLMRMLETEEDGGVAVVYGLFIQSIYTLIHAGWKPSELVKEVRSHGKAAEEAYKE